MDRITITQYQTFERYFKLYKVLFENEQYKGMSLEAKVTYSLLRDRLELSYKNNWVDDEGYLYLIFSNSALQDMIGCSKPKLIRIKKELNQMGLIEEVGQYSVEHGNRPNRIYLGTLSDDQPRNEEETPSIPQEESYSDPSNKMLPGGSQNVTRGVTNFNPNETNTNKTNNSDTKYSSRKAEKISEEISQPAGADDIPSQKKSRGYIAPKYYSLLEVIADRYNSKYCDYDLIEGRFRKFNLTHQQKMLIGNYMADGYVTSDEVLTLIDKMDHDLDKPLAYLLKSLDNLKKERRLEAKYIAHQQAEAYYGKGETR